MGVGGQALNALPGLGLLAQEGYLRFNLFEPRDFLGGHIGCLAALAHRAGLAPQAFDVGPQLGQAVLVARALHHDLGPIFPVN